MLFFCLIAGFLFCLTTICCHVLYSCLSYYCSHSATTCTCGRVAVGREGHWADKMRASDHMYSALGVKLSWCSIIQHTHICVCVQLQLHSPATLAQSMNIWYPVDKWIGRYGCAAKMTLSGSVGDWTLVIWSFLWHPIEWASGAYGI